MARQELDREDLLKEATALVCRVEYQSAAGCVVVVGLRGNGAGSIYFDAEPAYQFNRRLQLRRAYRQGRLWKAEEGRLAALDRRRSETEVALCRRDLTPSEQADWLSTARDEVATWVRELAAGEWQVTGAVPDAAVAVPRIREWLEGVTQGPWQVAEQPNAGA